MTAPHPILQDAEFCLTYSGEGAGARIIHGWEALVATVHEDAGHPDAAPWSETLADLDEWERDEDCNPFAFFARLEITNIAIYRLHPLADEVMLNGLPRAETDATASVQGLVGIAAPATGQSLTFEAAKPLASSGPDEPTPASAEPVPVELRQRMGRE